MKKNNCDNIGKYISQIYRKGRIFISKGLEEHNIGQGQFMYLLELYIEDGRNQEELAEVLKIDKGTTARAIKKLEENGFVRRQKDENDKRSNRVYLTEEGKGVKNDIFFILNQWDEKMSEQLNKEERELMIKLLKRVCSNINI
ncbi:MAG: MarR family transcriptional regulator [Terrisporobacter othiniensis]|uniref:MarR family transcriptional regulator n=1 Tax=Terrisporobacter hibernicus TaxID=2813371 RepID=A0AAX2ZID1_9FIRM|nr:MULTISPECIES: MarR family transcriptional regulator [Terrisporobacter]MDU4860552.1 MarR family transcriptional regulator [Terrisporobacter othiniensis]MDU6994411.1 MarR family transcriptional regulator [Terrisporobacter othiniensis]UEL48932.1 MarR family transcriptional regulator [Terrisporobacter hibernicus]SFJ64853.1 DNA-binding transcriptional regulator, MarR family [Terrisporobacter glycolicus]